MNKLLIMLVVVVLSCNVSAQRKEDGKKVDWETPKMYTVKKISLNTDYINLTCSNCKYIEIRTKAGLTGIFITGKGSYRIPGRSITDKFYGCMIRFNPVDFEKLITIKDGKKYENEQQLHASLVELKTVFKHCYHVGWDALIPEKDNYSVNFLGGNFKDLLAFYSKDTKGVYDFAEKKAL